MSEAVMYRLARRFSCSVLRDCDRSRFFCSKKWSHASWKRFHTSSERFFGTAPMVFHLRCRLGELFGGRLPVGAVLQCLGLLAQGEFFLKISRHVILYRLVIFSLAGEKFIAYSTETGEKRVVGFL